MKWVVCIEKDHIYLTFGKRYKVIKNKYEYYVVKNDKGNVATYYKTRFKEIPYRNLPKWF